MVKAGQECPDSPTMPSEEVRLLRAKIILEEALETIDALGCSVGTNVPDSDDVMCGYSFVAIPRVEVGLTHEPNLVEIADGCADISVVTIGTLVACGIPDDPLLKMVDQNNLEKFGPGSYRREDGKFCKAPSHRPPDIMGLLEDLKDAQEATT